MAKQVTNCQILRIMRQYFYWPKFLQVIFCYCLSRKIKQYSIWISPCVGAGSALSSFVFAGIFTAEEVYGQEIPHWLMYRHSWGNFWTCPWDLPGSFMKHFFAGKKQNFCHRTFLKCCIIRISQLSDVRLKELCCNIKYYPYYCMV